MARTLPPGEMTTRALHALHELAVASAGILDPAALAHLAVEHACTLLNAAVGVLYWWDSDTGSLRWLAHNDPQEPMAGPLVRPGEGAVGLAFQQRTPIVVENYPAWEHALPEAIRLGLWGVIAVPLLVSERAIGVLVVRTYTARHYPPEHVQLLGLLAAQVAPVLEAAGLYAALAASEAQFRTLFQAVPCGVLVRNAAGAIVHANAAAEQLIGLSLGQMRGRLPEELWEATAEDGGALPETQRPSAVALRTRQPVRQAILRITRPDGQHRWLRVDAVPVLGPDGAPVQVVTSFVDITERQQAEVALRQSEASFRLLFANHPRPMWVYALETRQFLEVNEAALAQYGYSRDEFLQMRITDIHPPEELPRLRADLAQARPALQQSGQWQHRCKDGRLIEVEIASHTLEFAGRPAVLVVADDVTERKQLEAQLRQAQKMDAIGQLAGGVAHDFNNLLTVITGFSDILQEQLDPADSRRGYVAEIATAADRAAALTQQLLAFSRRQLLTPEVLDLNMVVADTEKMLLRLLSEDIRLVTVLSPPLGRVRADRGQLEQVLLNLVVNARDAMPQGGQLTIETMHVALGKAAARRRGPMPPGAYVRLAVRDTGCGMDAETQARIFEPFFTTKESGKGTGLGLATVYGIVKQSGGYIFVASQVGQGTTVTLCLPQVQAPVEVLPPAPPPARTPQSTETILLVEDEEQVRTLVRRVLEGQGYTVLEACDGAEALAQSAQHAGPIHLLVTDVVMPGMSGGEVAQRLVGQRPDLRVLYVSGYTEDAVVRHGVVEASVTLLPKPFTPQALARTVRQVLDAPQIG